MINNKAHTPNMQECYKQRRNRNCWSLTQIRLYISPAPCYRMPPHPHQPTPTCVGEKFRPYLSPLSPQQIANSAHHYGTVSLSEALIATYHPIPARMALRCARSQHAIWNYKTEVYYRFCKYKIVTTSISAASSPSECIPQAH